MKQRFKNSIFYLVIAGFYLFFQNNGFADVHLKDENKISYDLYSEISILEDESNQLTIQSVVDKKFKSPEDDQSSNLSLGYTQSTYWIKFSLLNNTAIKDWLLEVGYPLLDAIDVYEVKKGVVLKEFKTGDHFRFSERPIIHRNFIFPITLDKQQDIEIFLKVKTSSSFRVPIKLVQRDKYFQYDQKHLFIQGLYFGILLVMMMYNLFIYLSIREKAYLLYVFYVGSYILVQAGLNGFSFQYLWPDSIEFNDKSIIYAVSLVVLFGSSFSITFLNLKQHLQIGYRIIGLIAIAGGINFLVAWMLPYRYTIESALILTSIGSIAITFSGLYLWLFKKVQAAKFFSIAWLSFLLGSLFIVLNRMHILADNFFTENAAQIGSTFEVILLSFALADKFNQLKKEKISVEEKAKESISSVNTMLQETMARLKQANKVKSDFLYNISHELRTPMNGIVGALQLFQKHSTPEEIEEYLELAKYSSEKMQNLIESILNFVKIQSGLSEINQKTINWDKLSEKINLILERKMLSRKISYAVNIPENIGKISYQSDQTKLLQFLEIILDNAIKYTLSGEINVVAAIDNSTNTEFPNIKLSVIDSGIGIDSSKLKQLKKSLQGNLRDNSVDAHDMGLGFMVAKALADMLNATIELDSVFGKGTSVTLTLKPST